MRRRIYEIIEVSNDENIAGMAYNIFMMITIVISIIPLAFKGTNVLFVYINMVTAIIFIIDYILRLITADFYLKKDGALAFIKYPFTPWAIIDLVSILPALAILSDSFKLLRLLRIIRTFRVFRVFKVLRYSKSMVIIVDVMKNSKGALMAVCNLALGYIVVSALIMFNVEPQSFNSFFEALYWATVSLTTVGYGDIYPVTTTGRIVAMISSLFGIAVIALPSGIITAGYMEAIKEEKTKDEDLQ